MWRKISKAGYSKTKSRVDFQVFILTAVIVIISCGLTFAVSYFFSYRGMIHDLSKRAQSIHDYAEEIVDVESFFSLRTKEDEQTEIYRKAKDGLEKARLAAGVRYLYTAGQDEDGTYIYLVDGLPSSSEDFRNIGDPLEEECIPDIEKAMSGETVLPSEINHTSWGDIFIAYFPMHDGDEVVGVIGIEFDAAIQYQTYRKMAIAAPLIIVVFCLVAAVTAVVMFRRISNPAYKDLANTDFLTGMKNRNAFEVDINNLDKIKKDGKTAIISADLDHLKQINDTLGHLAGDHYIKEGGRILEECMAEDGTIYRIGGDEFAVLFADIEEQKLKEMMSCFSKRLESDGETGEFHVSMSADYAYYDRNMDGSLEDTYRRADKLMYIYKRGFDSVNQELADGDAIKSMESR